MTLQQIAAMLGAEGFVTPRGRSMWDPTQVRRLLLGPERNEDD